MELITFDKAFSTVLASAFLTGTETVDFMDSLDRILASDIISDMDMPPFNKATVDGFACRRAELHEELEIVETIAAGYSPENKLSTRQCSRIMTGAAIPLGADMVFIVEESSVVKDKVRFTGSFSKDNIALKGEDIIQGESVLKAGRRICPQDIALMASSGCTSVSVGIKPQIGIISSGDELVEPNIKPGNSKIRNTNAWQLMAQVRRAGAAEKYYGIVKDDQAATYEVVVRAISENNIVLITGGVSMGDFDFVPSVLEKAGVKILFSRINIQPGKPTTFGIHKDALVFGLPGNPVSSFVQFELLVRPLLNRMMGNEYKPVLITLPMKDIFTRKHADRHAFVPVKITGGFAQPVEYHGSAHLSALSASDGLIDMPVGKRSFEKGEKVNVRQI